MKAQVVIIELITVVAILIVAIATLLPSLSYKDRWSGANLLLTERDIILTADRIGNLNSIAFNSGAFQNFVSQVVSNSGIIFWASAQGTFGPKITVACNCTSSQISELNQWIGTFELNQRQISLDFIPATLDNIPSSDVLFIFGFKNIEPYKSNLLNYLANGNGIVQMVNLQQNDITPAYTQIFGLVGCTEGSSSCGVGSSQTDTINPITNASTPYFEQYQLFYHLPQPIVAQNLVSSFPTEGNIPPCNQTQIYNGNFTIQASNSYNFWICGSSVYFDTNQNNRADKILVARQNFTLGTFNFFLSYVGQNYIYIAFRPNYTFSNFLNASTRVSPVNEENNRVFVSGGNYPGHSGDPIPAVVVNGTTVKIAWLADFTNQEVGDDEKLLLASLIFASANTNRIQVPFGTLQKGLITSYIGATNYDMFELYRVDVGAGYPF